VLLLSCSEGPEEVETNTLTFTFTAQIGASDLVFESQKYLTANNQTVTIDRINIYLSNVTLGNKSSGIIFSEKESYHLLKFDKDRGEATFNIEGVPADLSIDEITFSIGIDPEANTSIDNFGDLDPANGMAWDWNTGYKFFFLEGGFFPDNTSERNDLVMHIGTNDNYFTKVWELPEQKNMLEDHTVHFIMNGLAPFGFMDFNENTVFQFGPDADRIAQNYKNLLFELK
jgi:hypothetical protein